MITMVVMLVPAFRIVMMRAPGGFGRQAAFEIRGGQRLHRGIGLARPDRDAFLGEDGQRPPANAAHNDDVRALRGPPVCVRALSGNRECSFTFYQDGDDSDAIMASQTLDE